MHSYRIVIEYTSSSVSHAHPETWDWWSLLDIGVDEAVSVVNVEDIETPEGHKEELNETLL
jgi:hypothetical protein